MMDMTCYVSDRSTMDLPLHSAIKTDYPFLAHPPPQRKHSLHPLPTLFSSRLTTESGTTQATCGSRVRSRTFSSITAWAAQVHPGSPVPVSPLSQSYRRPSLRNARRPSVTSIRVPSASFIHIASTPTTAHLLTPSVRDCKVDLTSVGYAPVFLQLPNSPISATLPLAIKHPSSNAAKNISSPPTPSPSRKPRGLTHFRSLSILRPRSRSKSACPNSPTRMKVKTAVAVAKRKKAKYTMRPPPLVNELALMQFVDGGSMDDNIKRVMEAQAKAAGSVGRADVYRDGQDGVWWDQDEEWEYAHLLSGGDESRPHGTSDPQWVTFGGNAPGMPEEERRDSVSTQDSDLDPKYIVQPPDSLDGDDLALFGSAVAPLATHKPAMSVLSLPSRPRRAATHLRKPDFLVDVAFSPPHASPRSPKSPASTGMSVGTSNPRGKARRRPAPLKLAPPIPASKQPTNSPTDADRVRMDFIATSFQPAVSVLTTPTTAVSLTTPTGGRQPLAGRGRAINTPWRTVNESLTNLGMKTKPSMLNMIGRFRSTRKDDVMN